MRINVYSQELSKEVVIVRKVAETGIQHVGVRIMLLSPDCLHHTPDDDDRSGITFWLQGCRSFTARDLSNVFLECATKILQATS